MLIPRRSNEMMNSIGRNNATLNARRRYNPAFLHPDEIANLGVAAGDIVRVRSPRGSIQGVVQPDPRLRAGVLSMSHGFGTNPDEPDDPLGQGGCTSRLMDAQSEYDPVFGQPRMGALPVVVERMVPCG